jgi:serine/threonine protein kinase
MQTGKGSTVGRYELLTELGRGAMGIVYLARDPKIDRLVALKTISLEGYGSAEVSAYRARLFHEAQAAGRLSHPRIVTIFDVGESSDTLTPYIVMEYVPGNSLEEVLSAKDGRLPLENALRITQELAEALDYAHARSIVHRDIKPSNIIIAEDGQPKITDFGIAKLNIPDSTRPGSVQGTPAYMSPEQWNGRPVDGRSDLFSLGVILYTLLTGHRPFQGNSIRTISFKVTNRDPVPATALNPELPPQLGHVAARAIARDPAQRYQTGRQMALDLQDLRAGIAPGSKGDAALLKPGTEEDLLASSNYRSFSSFSQNGCKIPIETVGSRGQGAPRSNVMSVQFSQPWQQLSIGFITLGFLGLIFVGLWLAIPVKTLAAHSIASDLGDRAAKATAMVSTGISGLESKVLPFDGTTSTNGRGPSRLGHQFSGNNSGIASNGQGWLVQPSQKVLFSTLQISVAHHFATANLAVFVDDKLSFEYPLRGAVRKHMIVLKDVQGYFSDTVQVAAGEHRIRVRVLSQEGAYDESGRVSGSFAPGRERILRIDFGKDNRGMRLSLQ